MLLLTASSSQSPAILKESTCQQQHLKLAASSSQSPAILKESTCQQQHLKLVVQDDVAKHHQQQLVNGAPTTLSSPYPDVYGLPDAYHLFCLHHGGLPPARREQAIATVKAHHARQKSNFLGYQANFAPADYQHQLDGYMETLVNNMGDAFIESNVTMNSKFMERAVLDYYAALWHAKWPHCDEDPQSYWGFALTMGCTEGNLFGMWNAREYLSGKKILINAQRHGQETVNGCLVPHARRDPNHDSPNAYTPIAFFSEDTHFSFAKAMNMFGIRTFSAEGREMYPGLCPITDDGHWPAEVPSYDTGAMNIDHLSVLVEFFASHGYPIIISFNYGTTFRGAYDDVSLACKKLKPILETYGLFEREVQYIDDEDGTIKVDVRTGYWFHVDGALGAAYMPFVEMAYHAGLVDEKGPVFDFRLPMVHSIAMSGHKWIGAPIPCGIYMTKSEYRMLPPDVKHTDTTFSGSRNGLSPMLLWNYIANHSYEDQIRKAVRLEDLAAYVERRLRHLQNEVLKTDLYVQRTPLSLAVCFKRANEELCKKYSLANENVGGRPFSHVFLMDHVTRELVDAFIEDLSMDGAFAL